MTVFTHTGQGKAHVAFGAPYPGNIIPLFLTSVNGTLICQKDCFLAGAKGVSIGIYFQRKIMTALFGGEGLFFARLQGPGRIWLQSLPFSRLAGRMLKSAVGLGGSKDEGSVLGPLGSLLRGVECAVCESRPAVFWAYFC